MAASVATADLSSPHSHSEVAETRLREALTRLMEGDESANADLEKWSAVVESHPERIARDKQAAVAW